DTDVHEQRELSERQIALAELLLELSCHPLVRLAEVVPWAGRRDHLELGHPRACIGRSSRAHRSSGATDPPPCSRGIDEIILDYEVLGETPKGQYQLLLIAVKRNLINKYLELFNRLDLIPVAIETEPIAIARTVDRLYVSSTVCVIDIGIKTTDISVVSEDKLLFSRTVGMGGASITEEISEAHDLTLEAAEKYKKENNLFSESEPNFILKNLTTAIYRSLDYFQVKNAGNEIEKIVLTGGGGKLKGFGKHLTQEFGVKVEPLGLSDRLSINNSNLSEYNLEDAAQLLGVSIGLSLRKEETE
ncbi:MAG: pilus assembly protein PilM, partial [Halanaerobacter sp.]